MKTEIVKMKDDKMRLKERVILHCDVNNFYASVECVSKPELKGKPVAVSGNPKKRTGIILAKNDIAKSFGVKTGESIFEAKLKCPSLICLPPHFSLYEKISRKIVSIYYQYTDVVESFGIDECWLDVTNSLKLFGSGKEIADKIREQVLKEIGVTISVGVSFCKLFAKLGSDLKKPFATTLITKNNFKQIVYPLSVQSIIGIGKRINAKLEKMNVLTLGDYVKIPDNILKTKFNKVAVELKNKLLGNDFDDVIDNSKKPDVKSVGNGTTTIIDIKNREEVFTLVCFLSEKISKRLLEKNLFGYVLSVSLKTYNFKKLRKSEKINIPLLYSKDISRYAMKIIDSFWEYLIPIRSLRICISSLNSILKKPVQISFLEKTNDNKQKISKAIEEIKNKYGENSIELGIFSSSDFINKEKE